MLAHIPTATDETGTNHSESLPHSNPLGRIHQDILFPIEALIDPKTMG